MADEQIINLSPEAELTTVRARLEHAHVRRIILIIPPQTQLRSHISWRLLQAHARQLGKDVLIISSDRQIRCVVKVVGLRVAKSRESPPSRVTRQGSRSGPRGVGRRAGTHLHSVPDRSIPEDRSSTSNIHVNEREQFYREAKLSTCTTERKLCELETLYKIAQVLNSTLEFDEVLRLVMDRVIAD